MTMAYVLSLWHACAGGCGAWQWIQETSFFATGSADRTIKIWDLASGQLKLTLTGHIEQVRPPAHMCTCECARRHDSACDANNPSVKHMLSVCGQSGAQALAGCAGDRAGAVAPAPLHVLLRPGQAGQVLGPGVQQGEPAH